MTHQSKRALIARLALLSAVIALFLFCAPYADAKRRRAAPVKPPKNSSAQKPSASRTAAPVFAEPSWPHESSDLPADPEVFYGRLTNGIRYALMKNAEPADRVSVFLNVQAGSLYEEDNQRGLAHYLEHMLFNGSVHYQPGDMIKYFQSIGMAYGPDINAHTGWNETVFNVILPDGSEKRLDDGLVVLADYAAGALLLPSEIDRERGVILAEKKERDSVAYRTFLAQIEFLMPGTKASQRMPIGTTEVIEKADQGLLKSFYDRWYRPEKLVVVMVGDFDLETARRLIKKHFEKISPRSPAAPEPFEGKVSHRGEKFFHHYEKEAGNTEVVIETIVQTPARKDSKALQTEYLYRDMADAIVRNRLKILKDEPGCPFTAAYMTSGVFLKTVAFSNITAKTSPENWKKSLFLIDETLRRALMFGFTEDEVERVRKEYTASIEKEVLKAKTRNSTALAREIIDELNDDKVFMSPADEMRIFGPVIESATPQMLWRAFKKSWFPKNRLVQVSGNTPLPRGARDVKALYLAARNRRITRPANGEKAVFPFLPDPENLSAIAEREDVADIGVTRAVLENGVRVNLKTTDYKAGEILFTLRFGSGRADTPQGKPGLGTLASSVVNESGAGPLTREGIERALAGKNVSVSFSVNEDDFSFSGSCVPKEINTAFQLLYAMVKAPAFREKALKKAQERFSQTYTALAHKTEGALQLSGLRFLAGGDDRFGLPDKDDFMELTLEDVRQWIGPAIENEPLELSVVGDFDKEAVIDLARRYFGNLPARKGAGLPTRSRVLAFPKGGEHVVVVDTSIETGLALVAYPTSDVWEIKRTRRLNILSEIFSDRLREKIREKMGATYSPDATNIASRAFTGYGVMSAVIRADGDKARLVAAEAKAIADEMRTEGVSDEELKRAVAPAVTNVREILRSNSYWLGTVLAGSSRHPEQLEWCRTILGDYESINKAEVSQMASEWLVNEHSAMILVLPEPDQPQAVEKSVKSKKKTGKKRDKAIKSQKKKSRSHQASKRSKAKKGRKR